MKTLDDLLNSIQKNKDIVIKLKLDDDRNLIYLHIESSKQEPEVEKEKNIEDKVKEFDKEVDKKISSGNFTRYEIEEFIKRYNPINGTRI